MEGLPSVPLADFLVGSFEKGKRPGVVLIKDGPVDGIGGSSKVERLL